MTGPVVEGLSARSPDVKTCVRCGESKSTGDWPRSKQHRDGLFPYCRECKRATMRETYYRHRVRRIAEVRERDAANPDAAHARKIAWANANVEKARAARRRWQQANMATFVRASNARRRAVKMGAPTAAFHPSVLRGRWDYFGGRCWICGCGATAMDHVKPLSRGGWHVPANLRPVCTPCNTRKRDRWPFAAQLSTS